MSRRSFPRRRLQVALAATSGAAIAIAGVGLTTLPATAQSASDGPPAPTAVAGSSSTVTLITGDRVTVTDFSDGTHAVEIDQVHPGAGIRTYEAGGDLHVVPDDALPYLASGSLDRDLFNVSMLIAYGYDDASVDATPVIIEQDASAPRTFSAPLPGLEVHAELESIDASAVTLDHAAAGAAWDALTAPAARSFSATPSLAGGIEAIHLDGQVKAALDSSVDFIDAPEAWADGHSGEGVTVAVLDTGYDDTHPDLAGRVLAGSASFVPGEEVHDDPNGHGTHVAATIAGTGAASGGTHRGVADGAQLLVGKVLAADGWGQDSWIIEAMEWAGHNAPIVSMSLGSTQASDGKDLMAESLNRISAESGALFVVAAGNAGAPETIGAPGSAEQAFTVGSIDDPSGELSYFTSQGPLSRSGALKPNIAGPGNDVTAARSADSPGEGSYVSMSGTSMATPHVAGAAAILLGADPDATADELKAALASTARDLGHTGYQAGSGVVDVDAALEAPVVAAGSGDFGMLAWGEQPDLVERSITYTNRTEAEVSLDLEATGDITAGPLTIDAASVLIPAGQTATITMTLDPAKVPAGTQLSGALVGSIDGEPVTRTALGTLAEAERYDLALTATGFDGAPTAQWVLLWDAASQWVHPIFVEGETTLRLLAGDYSVMSFMELDRTPDTVATVLVGAPKVDLRRDTAVALDARTATQVSVDVGRKNLDEVFRRMDFHVDGFASSAIMPVWVDELWAQPMQVDAEEFGFTTRWRLWTPVLSIKAGKRPLDIIHQAGSALLDGELSGIPVDAGTGSADEFAAVDVEGRIALVTRSDEVSATERAAHAAAAGAALLLVVNDADGELSEWVGADDYTAEVGIPVAAMSGVEGRALQEQLQQKKKLRLTARGVPNPDLLYDIARYSDGEIPRDLSYRPKKLARIDTTYHGQSEALGEFRYDFVPGASYGSGYPMRGARGAVREEYVNTDQLRWYQNISISASNWEMRDVQRSYRAGERTEAEYYGGIVRPYVGVGYWVPYRSSGYAQVNLPAWADGGDPMHTGAFETWMDGSRAQQATDVYIDGVLVKHSTFQDANVSDLPDGEQEWRVVSTATHDGSYVAGSTRTVSDWTFRSAGQEGDWTNRLLPMIQAYYDVDVNADNLAGEKRRKGSPVPLHLELGHVAGSEPAGAITQARLEARTAGGAWKPIALKPAKTDAPAGAVESSGDIFVESRAWVSGYAAQIPVPDAGGWVDLRVTATDAAGNTFSQEIEKAFQATASRR